MPVNKEANILSQLSHLEVCFLLGVQVQQKPYYLLYGLYNYEVRGHALTVYDLLFPDYQISSKSQYAHAFHNV